MEEEKKVSDESIVEEAKGETPEEKATTFYENYLKGRLEEL